MYAYFTPSTHGAVIEQNHGRCHAALCKLSRKATLRERERTGGISSPHRRRSALRPQDIACPKKSVPARTKENGQICRRESQTKVSKHRRHRRGKRTQRLGPAQAAFTVTPACAQRTLDFPTVRFLPRVQSSTSRCVCASAKIFFPSFHTAAFLFRLFVIACATRLFRALPASGKRAARVSSAGTVQ